MINSIVNMLQNILERVVAFAMPYLLAFCFLIILIDFARLLTASAYAAAYVAQTAVTYFPACS